MATESDADKVQVGGDHYKRMGDYQPWRVLERWLTPEQLKGYMLGTAIAYLSRVNSDSEGKGGLPDVMKSHHYLSKLGELMTPTLADAEHDEVPVRRAEDIVIAPKEGPGLSEIINQYVNPTRIDGGHVDWAEPYLLATKAMKDIEKFGQFGDMVNVFAAASRVESLMREIKEQAI